jgi:hypothetical protein
MNKPMRLLGTLVVALAFSAVVSATFNYFQGFEVDTGDWTVASGITRVASGGGTLQLTPSAGNYYAEIQNLHDGYQPLFGTAGYSFYGGADATYHGDFYQSIDVYIDVNWPVPVPYPSLESFWIDMTPYHADPANFGAEHNFRIKALGAAVEVSVDGQTSPIATLTSSGWYTFQMTWEKDANPVNPVISKMNVYDSGHTLMGTTTVLATSPGGPFASADLRGNGYVWITLWQNGFGGDVLGIDNQRTALLPDVPTSKDQCKANGWQSLFRPDGAAFRNQGDCIQYVNTGK